jgi:hypothetical protein
MNAIMLKALERLPSQSSLVEDASFATRKSNESAPTIESRLGELAKKETLVLEIETFLLLLVGILGLVTIAYGLEQVFSFIQSEPVATGIALLLRQWH